MSQLQLNGFRAWVSVDNVALDHYNVEISPDQTSVTCWIPSEVGKHFVVHWTDTSYVRSVTTHTGGWVTVDGQYAGAKLVAMFNQFSFASIAGVTASTTTFRPFIFWPLDLTDDDSYLDGTSAQRMGKIILDIWSVFPGAQYYSPTDPVPLPMKIHERSKMGLGHCTRFGPEIYTGPIMRTAAKKISQLAKFTFKYRSLDILRADGIVPCKPQARTGEKRHAVEISECDRKREPKSVAVDDEKADAEELKALQDKINAIRARQATTKNGAKRIKVE